MHIKAVSITFLLGVLFLFFSSFILAGTAYSAPPDCWTKKQCEAGGKYRWYQDEEIKKYCENEFLGKCFVIPDPINLQVKIPKIESVKSLIEKNSYESSNIIASDSGEVNSVRGFPVYLAILYAYFTAAAGIVAVAMVAYGGYQWMAAGGNAEKISQAKSTIQGAVIGLILALGSYVLLSQINSRLVSFVPLQVPRIRERGLGIFCTDFGVDNWVPEKQPNSTPISADMTKCGEKYVQAGNNINWCWGVKCPTGEFCLIEGEDKYECKDGEALKKQCDDLVDVGAGGAGKCEAIDQMYVSSGFGKSFTCRLHSQGTVGGDWTMEDNCKASQLLEVPDGWKRINCSAGLLDDGTQICMDGNGPRRYYSGLTFKYCRDSKRVGVATDAICIVSKETKCDSDRPYDRPNFSTKSYDPLGIRYGWRKKSNCTCPNPEDKCWEQIVFYVEP